MRVGATIYRTGYDSYEIGLGDECLLRHEAAKLQVTHEVVPGTLQIYARWDTSNPLTMSRDFLELGFTYVAVGPDEVAE